MATKVPFPEGVSTTTERFSRVLKYPAYFNPIEVPTSRMTSKQLLKLSGWALLYAVAALLLALWRKV